MTNVPRRWCRGRLPLPPPASAVGAALGVQLDAARKAEGGRNHRRRTADHVLVDVDRTEAARVAVLRPERQKKTKDKRCQSVVDRLQRGTPPPPTLSMRTAESSWHSSSQDLEAEVCKSTQSDLETRERRFDTSNPLFQFGPTSNPIPCQDCERSRKPRRGKTR